MEALRASYGDASSDSESDLDTLPSLASDSNPQALNPLPPPPIDLLNPPNSLVCIPPSPKKELVQFMKKISSLVPGLNAVDVDIPLNKLCTDDQKLEQVALGREFHISLGRTVPIRVHQIDSMVAMLRQKLQFQRRYWIDFSKWAVFVNDDSTRSFLSIEVITGGLAEANESGSPILEKLIKELH